MELLPLLIRRLKIDSHPWGSRSFAARSRVRAPLVEAAARFGSSGRPRRISVARQGCSTSHLVLRRLIDALESAFLTAFLRVPRLIGRRTCTRNDGSRQADSRDDEPVVALEETLSVGELESAWILDGATSSN
ncbi:hypothetical protein G7043_40675 [Lentzea sp. NEAU-D13]|uniref:Uncharacterized protein n=1 Tax=Lentzea alba TaxID=2714351 RepID=A0A7C9RWK1_9PSEU|nr:hypothetical protein [Lentzea alba]NGY65231.1 hypothetical protein [Lentzea alba]